MRQSAWRAFVNVMDNWEEIKTAYQVAVSGTATAAAKALGVHRATIIRHIDSLEQKLGHQLFVRDTNGYTATEVGLEIMEAARNAEEKFQAVLQKIEGINAAMEGELIVTSMEVLSPFLMAAIREYLAEHPGGRVTYAPITECNQPAGREAHINLTSSLTKPEDPDFVFLPFGLYEVGLFASPDYAKQNGIPKSTKDFAHHSFIARSRARETPFEIWLDRHVTEERIVFRSMSPSVLHRAVIEGAGIGFLPLYKQKEEHPTLVKVMEEEEEWAVPLWLAIQKSIYHSDKVRDLITKLASHCQKFSGSRLIESTEP
ncbi:MAG: LysR family transcriptional regulator [Verrucomicrobiota bacterium]